MTKTFREARLLAHRVIEDVGVKSPTGTVAQMRQLAAFDAAPQIDAARACRTGQDEARACGDSSKAAELQQLERECLEDAVDKMAPGVYATIRNCGQIERVQLRNQSDEDLEYLTLCTAAKIAHYWILRPPPRSGVYLLTSRFVKSFLRDVIREAVNFGREGRRR